MAGEPVRVLLVEDSAGNARLTEIVLSKARPGAFAVFHAQSLGAALGRLAAERFDAVLLDLGLPDSDGLDTLVRVRQSAPRVPIIVLTGFGDEELGESILRSGAQGFLVKGQAGTQALVQAVLQAVERLGGATAAP